MISDKIQERTTDLTSLIPFLDENTLPQRRETVIIVDDDVSLRKLLGTYLFRQGLCSMGAASTEELETLLASISCDLIILDVMMPDETGLEFFRRVNETLTSLSIPVLFLTAVENLSQRHEGLSLGAYDYIVKPFEPKELVDRIHRILEKNQKKEMLQNTKNLPIKNHAQVFFFDHFIFFGKTARLETKEGQHIDLSFEEEICLQFLLEHANTEIETLQLQMLLPEDTLVIDILSELTQKLGQERLSHTKNTACLKVSSLETS